jgi:hypothetical protein
LPSAEIRRLSLQAAGLSPQAGRSVFTASAAHFAEHASACYLSGKSPQATSSAMTDTLPDRLSSNPNSPFYNEELLARDIGVRFKGVEKTNVEEYCVSEGWVRLTAGNAKDRHGNPMTVKLKGAVEPYFRNAE